MTGQNEEPEMESIKASQEVIDNPEHPVPTREDISKRIDSFADEIGVDIDQKHIRFAIWTIEELIPFTDYQTAVSHGLVSEHYPKKLFDSLFRPPEREQIINELIIPTIYRYGYPRIENNKILAAHRTINQLITLTWLAGDWSLSNSLKWDYHASFNNKTLGEHLLDRVVSFYKLDMTRIKELSQKYGRATMEEAR